MSARPSTQPPPSTAESGLSRPSVLARGGCSPPASRRTRALAALCPSRAGVRRPRREGPVPWLRCAPPGREFAARVAKDPCPGCVVLARGGCSPPASRRTRAMAALCPPRGGGSTPASRRTRAMAALCSPVAGVRRQPRVLEGTEGCSGGASTRADHSTRPDRGKSGVGVAAAAPGAAGRAEPGQRPCSSAPSACSAVGKVLELVSAPCPTQRSPRYPIIL